MRDLKSATDTAPIDNLHPRGGFHINSLLPWYSCKKSEFPRRKPRKFRAPKQELSNPVQINKSVGKVKATPSKPKSWSAVVKKHVRVPSSHEVSPAVSASYTSAAATEKKSANAAFAQLIETFQPDFQAKVVIQPRGFINTGNICFMNSILQALLYCVPFFNLLKLINKTVPYNFEKTTPLIESTTLFLNDFKQKWDKDEEQGESLLPEVVYSSTKGNPRFEILQSGEQEDAEEFLNLFLNELHEEFLNEYKTYQQKKGNKTDEETVKFVNGIANDSESKDESSGWTEVGKNKKPVIARSATIERSPISQIFGGQLRSTLRVPNQRDSVLLEPFQPLQLDIQSDDILSVTDTLEKMTEPEVLPEWPSSKGNVTATKQMYIESLPPVLILHLKRFFYDIAGGTQKNYKPVAYPADLTIPQSVFSPSIRGTVPIEYSLNAVVYHHGISASGGHYTVDVKQHDGGGWIRIDDTHIHKIRVSDVEIPKAAVENGSYGASSDKVAYLLFYTRKN
ncbi:ubiquitin carboxy terminal hydrolase Ubp3 [Schizosaccharomyces cryophilus OY26]|uniref:Ubiquitin carboxyl-terminal hydrolase n=1 Tax=Schizosaccharomyces cryophilus (strain OY26 / ATCC MYA-4695 / CBS 11777 / NBRC 106824 / NRRL Y48691) TaxID=653667 RepID=S9W748_SCHCR|nr:ubiquitin carboxy terminal hydrolase Ubp3 [Schizosaccharomyces cryophilus OY26]EPY53710.1 ubiquitin carboxy terminal hydrolase Ubp3 [Schizosaccharomyces cryophilus OY26]